MSKIFKPRRGTANTMSTVKSNTVLAAGELFAEVPNTGVGTGKGRLVMGDGVTSYGNLPSFVENTDVSTAQVTVTADNSQTSTAALNNVATGATTGAIVGSLKQAISLTKSELSNSIDEVYQAALEAGSGGIRWNSEANYIQLADENKNWVNYKYWNPTAPFELISDNRSGNIAYTFDKAGTYILFGIGRAGIQGLAQPTTTATPRPLLNQSNMRIITLLFANVGDTINTTYSNSYNGHCVLCYVGSKRFENSTIIESSGSTDGWTSTITIPDGSVDNILLGIASGNSTRTIEFSATTTQQFSQAGWFAIASTLSEPGTATIRSYGYNYGEALTAHIKLA